MDNVDASTVAAVVREAGIRIAKTVDRAKADLVAHVLKAERTVAMGMLKAERVRAVSAVVVAEAVAAAVGMARADTVAEETGAIHRLRPDPGYKSCEYEAPVFAGAFFVAAANDPGTAFRNHG